MPGGVSRRGVLVGIVAGVAGCLGDGNGTATETSDDNLLLAEVTVEGGPSVSSPAFEDGGQIPVEYGRDGENVNPPLSIRGVPEEAESLAVVLDDPDAPGGGFLHWLVWNVDPRRTTIPEGWEPEDATEGTNDFGNKGYGGPAPPSEHRYRFKLFALDALLDMSASASKAEVGREMDGGVLAAAQLDGRYVP